MRIVIEVDETKLADAINQKIDVPYVPESVEGRLFREGVSAGAKAAAELIGTVSSDFASVSVE